jgi:hypothetical protein
MASIINADTTNGLKLISDTSGQLELQSAGSTKVTVNTSGNMTVTGDVTATDITVTGNLTTNKAYFSAYANAASALSTTSSTYTVVGINTVIKTSSGSIFTISSSRVTVNKTGTFHIHYDCTTEVSSATSVRSTSIAALYKNGSAVNGAYAWMYNRLGNTAQPGQNTGSASLILDITSGDILDVRAARIYGTDTLQARQNASRITIIEL